MNTLSAANDHFLRYAAQHRVVVYAAIGVTLLLIIAALRFLAARRERGLSLNSSLTSPGTAPITVINEASSTRCTHCGAGLSSRQDFCPACGYAQPMKQTGTTVRFPG